MTFRLLAGSSAHVGGRRRDTRTAGMQLWTAVCGAAMSVALLAVLVTQLPQPVAAVGNSCDAYNDDVETSFWCVIACMSPLFRVFAC
jgi:hypothetical protein